MLKKEKLKKKLAKESTKVIFTHWTKKVIVEKNKLENINNEDISLEELVNLNFFHCCEKNLILILLE